MYWQKELETMPRKALDHYQLTRLKQTIACAQRSPFYGQLFEKLNITPDSFTHVSDTRKIPFTTKEQMRANYPYGFLAADKKSLVRLHVSSGTTGNPTVIFHNRHDLDSWTNLVARSLYAVGTRDYDVFQNICGYGLFTGGLGFQYGAERIGCLTVPAAAGNTKRQIKLITDFGTTVIHAIPSYVFHLYEAFEEAGLKFSRDTQMRHIVIGAEPHTEENRQRIQNLLGIKAYNSFGMTEMNGPGVAFECLEQNGMHLWEDSYLIEIINPETLEPVPDGEIGELVLTTLDRQVMPLIRYRTRDLTRILPGDCPCGRTHRRIDRIKGRTDDMFIIKGCNVFPMQVEKILMQVPEVSSNYLITLENTGNNDEMLVEVEIDMSVIGDEYGKLEKLQKRIINEIKNEVLVTPRVKLIELGLLPKSEGKAIRVRDMRCKS
jgi:phenylacetate-CoA ligase